MNTTPARRRTVLAAAAVAAAGAASVTPAIAGGTGRRPDGPVARQHAGEAPEFVSLHSWTSYDDWRSGDAEGTRADHGPRPAVVFDTPRGTTDYRDPHTKKTATWEYATWTSPRHRLDHPATEIILSWNADTPAGTWLRAEVRAAYTDGGETPWYTMGVWTAGDGKDVPRRTSVDGQKDGKSSVSTDTLAVDDADGPRFAGYRVRLTLLRAPDSDARPKVWRLNAMASDVPERFGVPASKPGLDRAVECRAPSFSQDIHKGQYPQYDGGGEAWCSPTSSAMIIKYWGRGPTPKDMAWINPDYKDPEVCQAARFTYDYQYEGCGNWPFNAAYAATYRGLESVVTRLRSVNDVERLTAAGIPVITSVSFIESELDGAGYGTAGHLMAIVGFTEDGDVIAHDPASKDDDAVRHVYKRRQWENIWLRTKRKDDKGKVQSASGGVCYVYFPVNPAPTQHRVLKRLGIL